VPRVIELLSACVLLAQSGEPTGIPILLRSEYVGGNERAATLRKQDRRRLPLYLVCRPNASRRENAAPALFSCVSPPSAHPRKLKCRPKRRENKPNTERLEGHMDHTFTPPQTHCKAQLSWSRRRVSSVRYRTVRAFLHSPSETSQRSFPSATCSANASIRAKRSSPSRPISSGTGGAAQPRASPAGMGCC
jgi:hypothetical protein